MATQSSNDSFAVYALRMWFNASPVSKSALTSFESAVDYYRKQGVFMDRFGALVRTLDQSKVKEAMENLAESDTGFPHYSEFMPAIAEVVGTLSVSDVAAAAGQGVLEAGKKLAGLATGSLFLYVAIAAIGVFILPELLKKGSAR